MFVKLHLNRYCQDLNTVTKSCKFWPLPVLFSHSKSPFRLQISLYPCKSNYNPLNFAPEFSFQLTRLIIEYVEDKDNENMESWSGYILALAMFLIAMTQTLCLQNNFHLTYTAGMRIRTAVIGAVYRKVGGHIFVIFPYREIS